MLKFLSKKYNPHGTHVILLRKPLYGIGKHEKNINHILAGKLAFNTHVTKITNPDPLKKET